MRFYRDMAARAPRQRVARDRAQLAVGTGGPVDSGLRRTARICRSIECPSKGILSRDTLKGILSESIPLVQIGVDVSESGTLRFDGHGALSAGAASRLLIDYSEPYRSQILDFLY